MFLKESRIGTLDPSHTFFCEIEHNGSLGSTHILNTTKFSKAYNTIGELAVSWLNRPIPDTSPLAITGLRQMIGVCKALFNEEDEDKFTKEYFACAEQAKKITDPMTNEEKDLFMSRCVSVKFGLVDNATDVIDSQRLGELVSNSKFFFTDDDEKEEFKKKVADCQLWECLKEYCSS